MLVSTQQNYSSIGGEARINDTYGDQLMFTTRFKF